MRRSSSRRSANAAGSARWARLLKKPQLAGVEGVLQLPQEQSAEQPRQHAHRQEEAGAASDPARAVERGAAAGHHAMDVRMMLQGLAPGVEHRGHADLGAEMLGIGGDGGERLGRGAEQDRIDGGLVLEGDRADRRRQGEDDVEVRHRQQLGLPGREPLQPRQPLTLRAMAVAAGVVGDARRATIIALLDMTAERRRPACRDGAHDASLDAAEMTGMRLSKRFAVAAEDIRHLQSRSHGARSAGRHDLQAEPIKRARRLADRLGGDPGVARRARQMLAWPSRTWMMRTSAPLSSRWVANVCRSVCTVTCLLRPAAAQAERQAACNTLGTSGRSSSRPGNSHRLGRASRQ